MAVVAFRLLFLLFLSCDVLFAETELELTSLNSPSFILPNSEIQLKCKVYELPNDAFTEVGWIIFCEVRYCFYLAANWRTLQISVSLYLLTWIGHTKQNLPVDHKIGVIFLSWLLKTIFLMFVKRIWNFEETSISNCYIALVWEICDVTWVLECSFAILYNIDLFKCCITILYE